MGMAGEIIGTYRGDIQKKYGLPIGNADVAGFTQGRDPGLGKENRIQTDPLPIGCQVSEGGG